LSIAAALVLEPDFIVADEPVSMLDVSIRTEILQLMMDLRKKRGLTYLFITHDLSLAWVLADRISVMYLGKIVETGPTEEVIGNPKHPYTRALISVVPSPDPRHRAQRIILKGERPDPVNIPTGCRFHPRCPLAFEKCGWNAEEVAEALRAERPDLTAGVRVADPSTLTVAVPPRLSPDRLAEDLRDLVASRKETRRAFFGVRAVTPAQAFVRITLHPSAEPELLPVGPDTAVACYLLETAAPVTPPPTGPPERTLART